MRRTLQPFAVAFLLSAACRTDDLPSGPETSIAPVETQTAALESDAWYARAKMPTGRYGVSAATVQGVVYVIGGLMPGSGAPTSKVEAYHPNTTTLLAWRPRAAMPEPRGFTNGAVAIDGKIYVSGGYEMNEDSSRVRTNSLFRYDPVTNHWSTRAPMPRATAAGASVAIDGKLYVYIVYGPEASASAELYRYDPATDQWTERAEPPVVQPAAAAAGLAGKMYVIGGGFGKGPPPLSTVTVYNPVTNSWSTKAPLLNARNAAVARVIDGRIYVASGASGPVEAALPTEVYDPATGAWTEKAEIPTPRSFAASAVVGGKLYVIGGNSSNGRVNEMYVP
jgi:N-acetylneuraminic acid mutarotase